MGNEINILELFSGIGGFTKGFQDAGYTIKKHYFSEIDKHAIANYRHNYPNAEYLGSVTNISGSGLRADVVTFGSPCQDFSLAGKRAGMAGQRSSLISEAIRLVSEIRPSVFIWENVKGTFSSNDGADFWAIIAAFANIGGYRLEWQLLNTSWVLPQNRERIYLIGHLRNRSEPGVFPIGEDGGVYNKSNENQKEIHTNNRNAITQQARQYSSWCGDFVKVNSATKQGYEYASEGDSINFSNINSKTRRGRVGKGVAQTLDTGCNQAIIKPVLTPNRLEKRQNGRRFKEDGEDSFTLGCQDQHGVMVNDKIRRLTEIECERLQGFPDDWTKWGNYDGKTKEVPKTQRYKMCGNAVTVAIVKLIAERIKLSK